MRRWFLLTAVAFGAAAALVLVGCGGSSGGGSAGGGGSRHAIAVSECQKLSSVMDDLEGLVAGMGADYVNDAATVDSIGDTVSFPSSVSGSYKTWREAVDQIASAMKEVGVKPNDTPLPSQIDELNSKLHGSDSLNKAGQAIGAWVSNDCD